MAHRNTTSMLIVLMVAVMIMGGCGWISGRDASDTISSSNPSRSSQLTSSLRNVVNAVYTYAIYTVTPNQGFLAGGEAILLTGDFPGVPNAANIYAVYFGDNEASLNGIFSPAFSIYDIYVNAPPGDALGFVAVTLFDRVAKVYSVSEANAYEYVDTLEIFRLEPDAGHVSGGTPVTVLGRFPVTSPITSLAEANSWYEVRIDSVKAPFTANALGQFITPDAMYVTTPPGAGPGFVDVSVATLSSGERIQSNGFRYFDDFELFLVDPDRGHVSGGELIYLGGSFPVTNSIVNISEARAAYTVYFGTQEAGFADFSDTSDPVITAEYMYVVAPAALAVGTVDVNIWSIDGIYSTYATVMDPLSNDYEYFRHMELSTIIPEVGCFGDASDIHVIAKLPFITADIDDFNTAFSLYSVEIDDVAASYRGFPPFIEITAAYGEYNVILHMITPPGVSPGTKNAALIDLGGFGPQPSGESFISNALNDVLYLEFPAKLDDAFTYVHYKIEPDIGPSAGFFPIQVFHNLPIQNDIFDLGTADSLYGVQIDGLDATWDTDQSPLVVVSAIYAAYTGYFNMLTPPNVAGLKDSSFIIKHPIVGDIYCDVPDSYTYIATTASFGTWTDVLIEPRPVGPVDPGELQVTITVSGGIPSDFDVFIVPQGGNPNNQLHRILLSGNVYSPDPISGEPRWQGFNIDPISTDMFDTDEPGLYPDGHAAVYLFTIDDGIIGDDTIDLTDGGTIQNAALTFRHFLIDTIPPVMIAPPLPSGLNAVNIVSSTNSILLTTPIEVIGDSGHPSYPVTLPGLPNVTIPFPPSSDLITEVPGTTTPGFDRAQIFFNVASISNNIVPLSTPLFLQVTADFKEDEPLDTPLFPDLFNGDTIRQPAGFAPTLSAAQPGNETEVLIGAQGDGDILARWVLAGGSDSLPNMPSVTASYEGTGSPIIGGFVFQQTGIPSMTQMQVVWDIVSGISPGDTTNPMHLVTKFAAGDRATIFYPKGDTSEDARTIMTTTDKQLDPLHIWWMREVNTNIIRDNIPASGVTRSPSFEWEIANLPRPELAFVTDPLPLFHYQLWQSPQSANLEDFRDGDYTLVPAATPGDWSKDYTSFTPILAAIPNAQNSWFLLTVAAIDEAGNVELWPSDLSVPSPTITVQGTGTENNWRRFYYTAGDTDVDTRVTPFFWHDQSPYFLIPVVNTGERTFGSQTIIPLPPQSQYFPGGTGDDFQQVTARFTLQSVNIPDGATAASISWEFFEDGASMGAVLTRNLFDNPNVVNLPFPIFRVTQGDPNRVRPVNYVFRAWASYTIDGNTVTDSTPVNIRFTVIPEDDVQKFLRQTDSDDEQPFKEVDRP